LTKLLHPEFISELAGLPPDPNRYVQLPNTGPFAGTYQSHWCVDKTCEFPGPPSSTAPRRATSGLSLPSRSTITRKTRRGPPGVWMMVRNRR